MIDRAWCTIERERDRRRSFLNYYFIIYKLLDLMGQPDLMLQVPLLRTRLRIRQHDVIWTKVCDKLGWAWRPIEDARVKPTDKPRQPARKRKPTVTA